MSVGDGQGTISLPSSSPSASGSSSSRASGSPDSKGSSSTRSAKTGARSAHSKVRTGCLTCKRRRVKCDEGRPACARCARAGLQCMGYQFEPQPQAQAQADVGPTTVTTHAPRHAEGRTAPVSLRPKAVLRKVVQLDSRRPPLPLAALEAHLTPVKLSSSDVAYFDMSRYYVLQDMRRWSFLGRFDQHVLRRAMHDECIRHAVLALSAMCRATRGLLDDRPADGPKWTLTAREFIGAENHMQLSTARGSHYRSALAHYIDATTLCREKLATLDADSLPTVIIATFIFTVLEMLKGNVEAMSRLLTYNDALLKMKVNSAGGDVTVLEGDAAAIKTELRDMFHHLSIKCALFPFFNDQRHLYEELPPLDISPAPADAMPFEMLRFAWEKTIRPIQKFFISLQFIANKGPEALAESETQQAAYLSYAKQWRQLVDRRLVGGPDPRARQELRAMKIDILVTLISLECCLDPTGALWDTKIKEFHEAANLLEKVARDTTSKHIKFLYEYRLFPTAALLISKCRDCAVRQHALDMLVELISRDTRWSGMVLVKALQTIIDLEEDHRGPDGLIPLHLRYAWVGSDWDFEENRLLMKLQRGDGLSLTPETRDPVEILIQV